jgi:hypothetical protein
MPKTNTSSITNQFLHSNKEPVQNEEILYFLPLEYLIKLFPSISLKILYKYISTTTFQLMQYSFVTNYEFPNHQTPFLSKGYPNGPNTIFVSPRYPPLPKEISFRFDQF